ncbi:hypothetical protein [Bacillus sp. SM2101]|uniref:hypothetical protein n=1 Tax=Bacillus sp. SM2101 TaxID=2805366 RepID=UPI001BDEEB96|nr:hypothetical protein [Bacillus sp. SM2101]
MKKIILWIVIVLIFFFALEYQKPVMTTYDAIKQAIACVSNPPERLAIKPVNYALKDLETVQTSINVKSGFFNQLTNQRDLSITLVFNGAEATVKMDAYSGKCIAVTGPLN